MPSWFHTSCGLCLSGLAWAVPKTTFLSGPKHRTVVFTLNQINWTLGSSVFGPVPRTLVWKCPMPYFHFLSCFKEGKNLVVLVATCSAIITRRHYIFLYSGVYLGECIYLFRLLLPPTLCSKIYGFCTFYISRIWIPTLMLPAFLYSLYSATTYSSMFFIWECHFQLERVTTPRRCHLWCYFPYERAIRHRNPVIHLVWVTSVNSFTPIVLVHENWSPSLTTLNSSDDKSSGLFHPTWASVSSQLRAERLAENQTSALLLERLKGRQGCRGTGKPSPMSYE